MYEEDRLRALELYSRMFEEAGDESALIQSLLSPTRQAVVVARAYNVNLGKLSVTSEKKAAPDTVSAATVCSISRTISGWTRCICSRCCCWALTF